MSEPKFCKDCKYFKPYRVFFWDSPNYELSKCSHKEMTRTYSRDLVSGLNQKPLYKYCDMARSFSDLCGINADYFEKRKPWWNFWGGV